MMSLFRPFIAIFSSLGLLILANGLCNTFIPIRLHLEGHSAHTIGWVTSSLYVGIFLGSLKLDSWIGKMGHIFSLIIFTLFMTGFTLLQMIWVEPLYWAALRMGVGIATAGIFIVIESWLLIQTAAAQRGTILSVYLMVFYSALSGGQLLIHCTDPMTSAPFYLVAVLSFASIIPLFYNKIEEPKLEKFKTLTLKSLFQISPLGFTGVAISGVMLAAIYGLLPVYAREIGLSVAQVGNLLALLIFGGLSFQWPLGKLADCYGRRLILNALSACTIALCALITFFPAMPVTLLFLCAFLFGGFSFTIYPISMAYVCENVESDELVAATGGFVLVYGVGAILGPLIAPLAMSSIGNHGLFYFLGLTTAILLGVGLMYANKALALPKEK